MSIVLDMKIDENCICKIESVLNCRSVKVENKKEAVVFAVFGQQIGNDEFKNPLRKFIEKENVDISESNVMQRIEYNTLAAAEGKLDGTIFEREFSFIAKNMSVLGFNKEFLNWCIKEENNGLAKMIMNRKDIVISDEDELLNIILNICKHAEKASFIPFNLLECVHFELCGAESHKKLIEFFKTCNELSSGHGKGIIISCFEKIIGSYEIKKEKLIEGRHRRFYLSKREKNIDDGCLVALVKDVKCACPEGLTLFNPIDYLIGKHDDLTLNCHNIPWELNCGRDWENNHPWYELTFGNKIIHPTGYALMGRKYCNGHFVKGWKLYGRKIDGTWVDLDIHQNEPFTRCEVRTYDINTEDEFISFKFEMTEPETTGNWAFCIGQMEIFGDIFIKKT
jgi:hypothetical protein